MFKHPHAFSSTARWIQFRETTLLPWIEAEPDNSYPRLFVEQVERILAYREAQPRERRFWRKDAQERQDIRAFSPDPSVH